MKCYLFAVSDEYGGKYLNPVRTCLRTNLFDITNLGDRIEVDVYEGTLEFFYRLMRSYKRSGVVIKKTGEGERIVQNPEELMLRLSKQQKLSKIN